MQNGDDGQRRLKSQEVELSFFIYQGWHMPPHGGRGPGRDPLKLLLGDISTVGLGLWVEGRAVDFSYRAAIWPQCNLFDFRRPMPIRESRTCDRSSSPSR